VGQHSFDNFVTLTTGWVLCTGRHTLTKCISLGLKRGGVKHHSALYRFVSRAKWKPDELGRVLFGLLLVWLPEEIEAPVDDTLMRRSGPHLFGAAMHYDAGRSSYARFGRAARKVLSFGHSWVTLAVWVPLPWNPEHGIAIPVLWRLYRPAKQCKNGEYRKRTELAAELVQILIQWLPPGRTLYLLGDSGYACKTLVRLLPNNAHFIGPMPMDAALYSQELSYKGRGTRKIRRGERLASPTEIIACDGWRWTRRTFRLYGQNVTILFKYEVCLWYSVAGQRRVKALVTRDPRGHWADRAYFCTASGESVERILMRFSHRWTLEQTYRDAKQLLGIDEPQNGWWRRRRDEPVVPKKPGPNPHAVRGSTAVLHTVPLGWITFGLVVVWYLRHGQALADVTAVQAISPWYRHKREPAFPDMLRAVRRELWKARIHADPRSHAGSSELPELLLEQLLAG
jgi:hypothetical protein